MAGSGWSPRLEMGPVSALKSEVVGTPRTGKQVVVNTCIWELWCVAIIFMIAHTNDRAIEPCPALPAQLLTTLKQMLATLKQMLATASARIAQGNNNKSPDS